MINSLREIAEQKSITYFLQYIHFIRKNLKATMIVVNCSVGIESLRYCAIESNLTFRDVFI